MSKKNEPKKATRGAKAATSSLDTGRRSFLKNAGIGGAAAVAGSTLAAPYVKAQGAPIKWRLQTYSGAPLGAHVIKPQIEAFNKAANGEMEIRSEEHTSELQSL